MKSYSKEVNRIATDVHAFLSRTFTSVNLEGPPVDSDALKGKPVMAVCTHRSHTDYFILGAVANTLGIENVRFAAGDNLTDLPYIGPKFKSLGAFPVSREKATGRSYLKYLCSQVVDMLNDGDNMIVFPEGGRSYRGNMMKIRGGIIGAHVLSQWRNRDKKHYYLPAAISYEQLPELRYFDMLERGRTLRKGAKGKMVKKARGNLFYFGADAIAFSKFLLANKVGAHYGNVYIDYDEPVAVEDLVDLDALHNKKQKDEFYAHRAAMQQVGDRIYQKFQSLLRLLPMHILAGAMVGKLECGRKEAVEQCGRIMDRLHTQDRNVKSLEGLSEREIVAQGMRQLATMHGVSVRHGRLQVKKSTVVKYYAAALQD